MIIRCGEHGQGKPYLITIYMHNQQIKKESIPKNDTSINI
jgi:hypothetical protein